MRHAAWIVLLVMVLSAVRAATSTSDVPGDFLRYHRAGRLVWTGKADKLYDVQYRRGQHVYAAERAAELAEKGEDADDFKEREWKYAPATAVLLAPIGALHPKTASVIWAAWNALLVSLLFVACWRWAGQGLSAKWMWLAVLVLYRAGEDNLHLGQLNPSAIVPGALGLVALARGRQIASGVLIAFGTVVKFMPGFLCVWLAWKRRWTALGVWVAATLLIGYALPAVVLGPARSHDINQAWVDARAHHYTSAESRDLPGHSIKSFVYRTLGDVHYIKGGSKPFDIDVSVAHLPPTVLFWLVMTLNLAVIAFVFVRTKGPQRGWNDPRGPPEAALMLTSLLLVSPEARSPHFLYIVLGGIALTYALVRTHREVRGTAARLPTWWRTALALTIVGALLLNTDSKSLFSRAGAAHFNAFCGKGWTAVLWMGALALLLPRMSRSVEPDAAATA